MKRYEAQESVRISKTTRIRTGLVTIIISLLLAAPARAEIITPDGDVFGVITLHEIAPEENLYTLARQSHMGIVEMLAANPGLDPWLPPPGHQITLTGMHILPPGPREGIVINLSELRLFYYLDDGDVMTFPIGIGREGWQTPLGVTKVLRKRKDPAWTPPPSIRAKDPDLPIVVPAGPDNPLGQHALYLGFQSVLIHGTNRPYGVGKRSSHGCIRLYPEDIEVLFEKVKIGTKVTIIDEPLKLGWRDNTLYMELSPTQEQADWIAEYRQPVNMTTPEIYDKITGFGGKDTSINWYEVERAIQRRDGIPTAIGTRS